MLRISVGHESYVDVECAETGAVLRLYVNMHPNRGRGVIDLAFDDAQHHFKITGSHWLRHRRRSQINPPLAS